MQPTRAFLRTVVYTLRGQYAPFSTSSTTTRIRIAHHDTSRAGHHQDISLLDPEMDCTHAQNALMETCIKKVGEDV